MTIGTLTITIAIVALILTGALAFTARDRVKNWLISYLQIFCGVLFIFSGWVKAVDPLGTAYKMEQYFAEFESTFSGTWFSFIAPMFPWLAESAILFSVVVIVFEIVLGIMLLIGSMPRITSWAFFLLVFFFTFLTGFTYLTGYVPDGVNFFQFGSWGPYVETNMKVTDCGCFGDFIKLKPKVSFFKDVFLLIPAILFLLRYKDMHQLFSGGVRANSIWLSAIALTLYCMSNYYWNLPHTDFRPFKEGVNVAEQKMLEEEAQANVEIIAYDMKNKSTGEELTLPFDQYMKEFKNYPKEEWELEQVKSEPEIESTKISEFEVSDAATGDDMTEDILSYPDYQFVLVAYKLYGKAKPATRVRLDTVYRVDTVVVNDVMELQQVVDQVNKTQESYNEYTWDPAYLARWTEVVNPVMNEAGKNNIRTLAITSYSEPDKLESFKAAAGCNYPIYVADDILLKTIIRSNPGIILMKNGEILKKWHVKRFPDYATVQKNIQ